MAKETAKEAQRPTTTEADEAEIPVHFQEPPPGSDEYVEVPESVDLKRLGVPDSAIEEGKEPVVVTPDVTSVLTEQFGRLSDSISSAISGKKDTQQEQIPSDDDIELPKRPGKTEEEFWEEAGENMFDSKQVRGVFTEAVQRTITPAMMHLAKETMFARRDILELRPATSEIFAKYRSEIEKEARSLIKQYGVDPKVYEVAFKTVKARHADEIIAESTKKQVDAQVEARVREELKKRGVPEAQAEEETEEEAPSTGKTPRKQFGGSSTLGGGRTRRVRITPEIEREAMARGLTVQKFLGL